jgi:hypothetical protein
LKSDEVRKSAKEGLVNYLKSLGYKETVQPKSAKEAAEGHAKDLDGAKGRENT